MSAQNKEVSERKREHLDGKSKCLQRKKFYGKVKFWAEKGSVLFTEKRMQGHGPP